MSNEALNANNTPKDEQLIALRQEFSDQGFVILAEWAGSIRELTDDGPFVLFHRIGEDGKAIGEEQGLMATLKLDAIGGVEHSDLSLGKIFYLTAYQDPADQEAQLHMTFWKPRELSDEELERIKIRARELHEKLTERKEQ